MSIRILLFVCLTFLSRGLMAESLLFQSGVRKNVLIELFTSEGCSSCPPAERHLNKYTENPKLWRSYIPVALHVDYWDYLGWKDPFAKARYTLRQRQYARWHNMRTVYTPAFFVNGAAWRPGWFMNSEHEPPLQEAGQLELNVTGREVRAAFQSRTPLPDELQLNLALLGMGITSHITRGENTGRTSRHDFVALQFLEQTSRNHQWTLHLPEIVLKENIPRLAIAAWVQRVDNPLPLQAVGGYLPRRWPQSQKVVDKTK